MPPRAREPFVGPATAQTQQDSISDGIENFELPRSLVLRLARARIPENTKLQKEVVLSLTKASTVFINYLGATAHDVASSKQHKSISASDVLKALEMVGLGDMVSSLQDELQIYRDIQKADKSKRGSGTKGKARESEFASASAKSKGKGKEKEKGPTITIAPPRAFVAAVEPDADDEPQPESDGDLENDEEIRDEDEDDAEMEDNVVDDDEEDDGGGTEPDNVMALEDEELRLDANALEHH